MPKNTKNILLSFGAVLFIILAGTIIAYRTNTIPGLKEDLKKEKETNALLIQNLEEELARSLEKQREAEKQLKEKLAEEERIALEEERKLQEARIATEKAATARVAAEAEASKKSKAS